MRAARNFGPGNSFSAHRENARQLDKPLKMFHKVLVVEDIDSINIGLTSTLSASFDFAIDHSKYCDNAFLKLKKALADRAPYDLLITDLSFKGAPGKATISSGDELLRQARALQPTLFTIIYSVEDRPHKLREYLEELDVNGYVLKGRDSSLQMIEAIKTIGQNGTYLSPELSLALKQVPSLEIDDYDLMLLRELGNGFSQHEISARLAKEGITPSSLSSIEKRINRLKDYFMARNIPHLIAQAKDMGLF
jgi:DNA-binding NarL/FixJ family response regulator